MSEFGPRLNDAQRAAARRRWEGSPNERFGWLAAECLTAWGITITRQALRKAALKAGWTKGGEPSEPLAYVGPRVVPKAAPVPNFGMLPKQRPMIARTGARFVRLRGCPPGR